MIIHNNRATFEESYFSMENTQYNLTNNFSYSLNQTSIPGPIRNNEFIKYTSKFFFRLSYSGVVFLPHKNSKRIQNKFF